MSGYPVVLTELAARRCVVVGGGSVAARKVEALAAAEVRPVVISPGLCPELEGLVAEGSAEPMRRPYRPGDLAGAALAIAATDDRSVNEAVAREARERGILVNVVDAPELCSFTVPAVIRRRHLLLTISTDGRSPAFARHLRESLEAVVDPAYGDLLDLLADLRPRVQAEVSPLQQPAVWQRLLDGELLALLRQAGATAARARGEEIVESFRARPPGQQPA